MFMYFLLFTRIGSKFLFICAEYYDMDELFCGHFQE